MIFLNINFNNDENKLLSLACRYWNDDAAFNKFGSNEVSISSIKKHGFVNRIFTLVSVYRKQPLEIQIFSQAMQSLLAASPNDIVVIF